MGNLELRQLVDDCQKILTDSKYTNYFGKDSNCNYLSEGNMEQVVFYNMKINNLHSEDSDNALDDILDMSFNVTQAKTVYDAGKEMMNKLNNYMYEIDIQLRELKNKNEWLNKKNRVNDGR